MNFSLKVLFHGVPETSGPGAKENIYLLGHAVCDVITKTLGVREELVITEMFRYQTSLGFNDTELYVC